MDPDKALEELQKEMAEIQTIIDRADPETGFVEGNDREYLQDHANRAVDLWNGLDRWMREAGAMPRDWSRHR